MKNLYKNNKKRKTNLRVNNVTVGEHLESKIERMVNNGEPLDGDGTVQLIYTERKDGVGLGYDIRTDRFEVAVDASDKVSRGKTAKRAAKMVNLESKKEEDGGAESIDGVSTS